MNKNNIKYNVQGNKICLDSGKIIKFDYPVIKTLICHACIVVLLEVPVGSKFNENVFAIDEKGNLLWQIAKRDHVYEDSPYTSIECKEDLVGLYNWDGLEIRVDPFTGKVLQEKFRK